MASLGSTSAGFKSLFAGTSLISFPSLKKVFTVTSSWIRTTAIQPFDRVLFRLHNHDIIIKYPLLNHAVASHPEGKGILMPEEMTVYYYMGFCFSATKYNGLPARPFQAGEIAA